MKKIFYLTTIVLFFISCSNDEMKNNTNDDDNPWIDKIVFWDPAFVIIDTNGNNLFENNTYRLDKLSISATDENWNILKLPNGKDFTDKEGYVEILEILYNENNKPIGMKLGLGYHDFQTKESKVTSYYKLKYDDDKYDYIIVKVDISNNNYIITDLNYNGVDYTPSNISPVTIVK